MEAHGQIWGISEAAQTFIGKPRFNLECNCQGLATKTCQSLEWTPIKGLVLIEGSLLDTGRSGKIR
jgi:hypothetical protein